MPVSYCNITVHIVFSTKQWHRWIKNHLENDVYSYIAGIIKSIKGKPLIINGTEDHIHILSIMPKDKSISDFVRAIKAGSSKWFRENHNDHFKWQEGYGAFSVGLTNLEQVRNYILHQKEHHKRYTGEEEYEKLLLSYNGTDE